MLLPKNLGLTIANKRLRLRYLASASLSRLPSGDAASLGDCLSRRLLDAKHPFSPLQVQVGGSAPWPRIAIKINSSRFEQCHASHGYRAGAVSPSTSQQSSGGASAEFSARMASAIACAPSA